MSALVRRFGWVVVLALVLGAPRVAADEADELHEAAKAKIEDGEYDAAIELLDKAIALDPKRAVLFQERGIAHHKDKDLDAALADYSRAIELDAALPMAWTHRSSVRRQKGDYAGSLADADRAIALDPRLHYAYIQRGIARHIAGELPGAAEDLARAIELGTVYRNFPGLIRWSARVRAGDHKVADDELRKYVADSKAPMAVWPIKVAKFLLGEVSEDEIEPDDQPEDDEKEEACEAWYFIGIKRLVGADAAGAAEALKHAVALGNAPVIEWHLAKAELARLEAKPR